MSDKWFEFETDDQGRHVTITVGKGDEKPRFIGSATPELLHSGKQALSAASDFYHLGLYECEPGVHLFTEPDEEDFNVHIGYIAQWSINELYPKPVAGWAPLIQTGKRYEIVPFDGHQYRMDATAKHDAMEHLITGGRLKVRMFSRQGLAAYYEALWKLPRGKALEKSGERKGDRATMEYVTGRSFSGTARGRVKKVKIEIPEGWKMPVKSGVTVDMDSMPYGWYWVVKRTGRKVNKEEWNGDKEPWFRIAKAGMLLEEAVTV